MALLKPAASDLTNPPMAHGWPIVNGILFLSNQTQLSRRKKKGRGSRKRTNEKTEERRNEEGKGKQKPGSRAEERQRRRLEQSDWGRPLNSIQRSKSAK